MTTLEKKENTVFYCLSLVFFTNSKSKCSVYTDTPSSTGRDGAKTSGPIEHQCVTLMTTSMLCYNYTLMITRIAMVADSNPACVDNVDLLLLCSMGITHRHLYTNKSSSSTSLQKGEVAKTGEFI